jgi:5-methylcytosine-specific restriction endonuclease McrA
MTTEHDAVNSDIRRELPPWLLSIFDAISEDGIEKHMAAVCSISDEARGCLVDAMEQAVSDAIEKKRNEKPCACQEAVIVKKQCSDGRWQAKRQCVRCLGTRSVSGKYDIASLPCAKENTVRLKQEHEYRLRVNRHNASIAIMDKFRGHVKTAWHDAHEEFMRSPRWASIRKRVLERDRCLCQGCLMAEATVVHHLNYNREFGDELMYDLVSLCRRCHDRAHNIINEG